MVDTSERIASRGTQWWWWCCFGMHVSNSTIRHRITFFHGHHFSGCFRRILVSLRHHLPGRQSSVFFRGVSARCCRRINHAVPTPFKMIVPMCPDGRHPPCDRIGPFFQPQLIRQRRFFRNQQRGIKIGFGRGVFPIVLPFVGVGKCFALVQLCKQDRSSLKYQSWFQVTPWC